jgi:hypothetical protein
MSFYRRDTGSALDPILARLELAASKQVEPETVAQAEAK